jgi:hypothetical protein
LEGQFKNVGLSPVNPAGFVLVADIDSGKKILPSATFFEVNNQAMELGKDFFPFVFSATGTVKNETSPSMREINSAWFLDIKDLLKENAANPQYNISNAIYEEAKKVAERKARALIVYNSSGDADNIVFDKMSMLAPLSIPVIYVTSAGMKKHFNDLIASYNISLKIDIAADLQKKTSVAALMNNKSSNTIVICAPYIQGESNSGSASALAELAFSLKKTKRLKNNYLFVAFPDNKIDEPSFTFFPNTVLDGLNTGYVINLGAIANETGAEALNNSPTGTLGNAHLPVFFVNTGKTTSQKIDSEHELEVIRSIQKFVESPVKK